MPFRWLPACAAALHVFEEFARPGGFAAWYRAYAPDLADSITTRFLVVVNAVLLAMTVLIGALGPTDYGVALWLAVAALLFGNGVFHIAAVLRTRRYSPGVVTGTLLYLPLAAWGYPHFLRAGLASPGTAVSSALIGASYPAVSAWNHRRRVRNQGGSA